MFSLNFIYALPCGGTLSTTIYDNNERVFRSKPDQK